MTEIIYERIQIQSKAKKCINKPENDTPEGQKLAVPKVNNYSRLSIDLNIIFADGFAGSSKHTDTCKWLGQVLSTITSFYCRWLCQSLTPKHFTKLNKLTK